MKKCIFTLTLVFIMCLMLIPVNAVYADSASGQQYSDWAKPEIEKAAENNLIPDSLKKADLTKTINREEFCELALLLYEKGTGSSPAPVSPNPFTDTANPQILKAFALGITQGTSTTTFSPQVLINREQCATMLYRTLKAVNPDGNYTIAGVSDFPDQKDISSFAVEGAKFMSKLGIIKGDINGNFMPKPAAVSSSGYGMATREAAILMSVRSYGKMGDIKSGAATSQTGATDSSVIGSWALGTLSGGKFNSATGKYEGGASGLGQIYTFRQDGTYTALVIWSNAMNFTGKYSVEDGVITLTDRIVEESSNDGSTWGTKEKLPDALAYFIAGTDESGKYLLIGEEGAAPPLVEKQNAFKYKSADQKTASTEQKAADNISIVGTWSHGMTGAVYNIGTGAFDFGPYGIGHQYKFNGDGTFVELITSGLGSVIILNGNYAAGGDTITFTYTGSKGSSDYGNTWKDGNTPPATSRYYKLNSDRIGNHVLIGLESAALPLDENNAVYYYQIED